MILTISEICDTLAKNTIINACPKGKEMKMMRMYYQYKEYPKAPTLTKKSARVGILTNPLFGATVGMFIGIGFMVLLVDYAVIALLLTVALMIAVPLLLRKYRQKKFEQYDAEYAKMMEEQKGSKNQASEEKKSYMRV